MTSDPVIEIKFNHQGKTSYAFIDKESELNAASILKAFRSVCGEADYSDHILEFDDGSGDYVTLNDDQRLIPVLQHAAKKSENGRRITFRSSDLTCGENGCIATSGYSFVAASVRLLDGHQKLNYMQLKLKNVRKVLLVAKPSDRKVPEKARDLVSFLIRNDLHVFIEQPLLDEPDFNLENLKASDDRYKTNLSTYDKGCIEQYAREIDLVVTLGGDGTVLYTSALFQEHVPPVLSVFMGSLGFLTNVHLPEFPSIMTKILQGEGMRVTLRRRLHCSFYPDACCKIKQHKHVAKPTRSGVVLVNGNGGGEVSDDDEGPECSPGKKVLQREVMNELVLDRGPHAGLLMLDLYADGLHLTTIQADGLIIATATGSTAYSLSSGGSLVHPDKASMLITPICAHTLTCRPMILPFTIELKIRVSEGSRISAWASFDGRDTTELKPNDAIRVTASRYPFLSLCRVNPTEDWCRSLISTLHWNEREKQLPFS
ncbi:hypothetical protein HK097_009044 [Rhizophlyctis rosea]|uniref:NAD(+) kinase n=1 Tax=Rhizophlyctis rosea TaxID=64517 RepID=A0AAD5X493_9FUNG|nr:hypothetical protein HK097_009044 [Rhizophlyctis rosea]